MKTNDDVFLEINDEFKVLGQCDGLILYIFRKVQRIKNILSKSQIEIKYISKVIAHKMKCSRKE